MRVKLEDVCERGTSSLMQKDIVDKNGKYPVYGASGRIGSMETYQQEHQTVAVVKDGAGIGRTMLLPEKSSVIGTMQYLIPKNCIESEYLYYVVKYMHLEKYFSGATIPHIYFRDYKTEEFNLHDKTEQREIVSTLKRIEAIISNRQEQLTKLDELIKARFVGYKCSASSTSFTMSSDTCPGALACPGFAKVMAEPKVSPARRLTAPSVPMLMVMTGVSG